MSRSGSLGRFFLGTLRGRLILSVAAVHAALMSFFILDASLRQRAMLRAAQEESATAICQALATSAALWVGANDLSGLQELVESARRFPEAQFAMITDARGRILAHTEPERLGQYVDDLPAVPALSILHKSPACVDTAAPCILNDRLMGWARVGLGQKRASERLRNSALVGLAYALAAILIGSGVAWVMGSRMTRRIYAIQGTIARVRSGQRGARTNVGGSDEAAAIAREFDGMLDALAERDRALVTSEARYRFVLDSIHAAVVVHGADTRILMSNPTAREFLGFQEEELEKKTAWEGEWSFVRENGSPMPVEDYPVHRAIQKGSLVSGMVAGIVNREKPGIRWVLAAAAPIYREEGSLGEVIVTFVDITERRRSEAALAQAEKMHSLGVLASGIAHEISQPLTALGICVETLPPCDGAKAEVMERKSGEIRGYLLRIRRIIEQVRLFSRARPALHPEAFSVQDALANVLLMVEAQFASRGIALKRDFDAALPAVRGDLYQFEQVLVNLLSNARDAVEEKSMRGDTSYRKEISVRAATKDGGVRIEIRDNGVGLSPLARENLFTTFFTTKAPEAGTGLGLSISFSIVKAMGGEIHFESVQGEYTTALITLPVDR